MFLLSLVQLFIKFSIFLSRFQFLRMFTTAIKTLSVQNTLNRTLRTTLRAKQTIKTSFCYSNKVANHNKSRNPWKCTIGLFWENHTMATIKKKNKDYIVYARTRCTTNHRRPRLLIRLLENVTRSSVTTVWIYKGLYGRKRFRNYSQIYVHFENKIDLPQCLVVFLVVISLLKPIWRLFGEF